MIWKEIYTIIMTSGTVFFSSISFVWCHSTNSEALGLPRRECGHTICLHPKCVCSDFRVHFFDCHTCYYITQILKPYVFNLLLQKPFYYLSLDRYCISVWRNYCFYWRIEQDSNSSLTWKRDKIRLIDVIVLAMFALDRWWRNRENWWNFVTQNVMIHTI